MPHLNLLERKNPLYYCQRVECNWEVFRETTELILKMQEYLDP